MDREITDCAKSSTFPLFKLPFELRRYVYQLAMRRTQWNFVKVGCPEECPPASRLCREYSQRVGPVPYTAALLFVCRTIYSEAIQVIYEEQNFFLQSPLVTAVFMNRIGSRASYLRTVSIWLYRWDCPETNRLESIFGPLIQATNLKRLAIGFSPETGSQHFRYSFETFLTLFETVAPFLAAMGRARGGDDYAAIDILLFTSFIHPSWHSEQWVQSSQQECNPVIREKLREYLETTGSQSDSALEKFSPYNSYLREKELEEQIMRVGPHNDGSGLNLKRLKFLKRLVNRLSFNIRSLKPSQQSSG